MVTRTKETPPDKVGQVIPQLKVTKPVLIIEARPQRNLKGKITSSKNQEVEESVILDEIGGSSNASKNKAPANKRRKKEVSLKTCQETCHDNSARTTMLLRKYGNGNL